MTTLSKSDKLQNYVGYLFIGIWICALIGFQMTYTRFFPTFKGFHWEQHFHGVMLMSWFAMLIVQPFLIKYRKYQLHRNLGKLGYVLAPLVCLSIFLVTKMVYHREIVSRPESSVLGQLSLDIPTIFIFGLFFCLAMINRHKSYFHMRYMIGTSLLMIGPGLGRAFIIFGGMPFPMSITTVYLISEIIALFLLFTDFKNGHPIRPFLTILILLTLNHLCWVFQDALLWQKFAKWFVTVAF